MRRYLRFLPALPALRKGPSTLPTAQPVQPAQTEPRAHTKTLSWVRPLSPVSQSTLPAVGPTHLSAAEPRCRHLCTSCSASCRRALHREQTRLEPPRPQSWGARPSARQRPGCPRGCSLDPVASPPNPRSPPGILCSTLMPSVGRQPLGSGGRLFSRLCNAWLSRLPFTVRQFWEAGPGAPVWGAGRSWAVPNRDRGAAALVHSLGLSPGLLSLPNPFHLSSFQASRGVQPCSFPRGLLHPD